MEAFEVLFEHSGFASLSWQNLVMFVVAGTLMYLAVKKSYEPLLLIPIGFGAVLANLPNAMMSASAETIHSVGHGGVPLLQLVYD